VEDQGLSVSGHSPGLGQGGFMIRSCLSIALALSAVSTGAAQAQPAPASPARPANQRFAPHPYKTALGALANYQSCGVHVRAAAFAALNGAFREAETAARAKGLGPHLDELYHDWQALLAVSTMMACARGPAGALAGARTAVRAFQAWAAAQPPAH
jgi:hypothetical protein